MSRTHSGFMGRAWGPDSPPTMIQSIPLRFRLGVGPRRGSREMNFMWAGVFFRWSMRKVKSLFSTLTPIQMF